MAKTIIIEANTMVDMARTEILPAVQVYTLDTAKKYWPFPTYGDLLFEVR